jgi:hypothetical protein
MTIDVGLMGATLMVLGGAVEVVSAAKSYQTIQAPRKPRSHNEIAEVEGKILRSTYKKSDPNPEIDNILSQLDNVPY